MNNNLPTFASSFIGRTHELRDLRELAVKSRLLTVVGVGGIGKTRLVLQLATDTIAHYPDGAWFVSLKELFDPARIAETIGQSLGGLPQAESSDAAVFARLRQSRALLVLDNAEHLLDAVAALVRGLLENAPLLTIVVTSREALQLAGESIFKLDGIDEGTRLFIERAYPERLDEALSSASRRAITAICRKLQAIPLAIELAAARAGSIPAEELASHIEAFSSKHAVLEQMLQWSYRLLPENEQRYLDTLALFEGAFTWEAAGAVCAPDQHDAVATLASLVNKSLVVTQHGPTGVQYYLLEIVREFANERLRVAGNASSCTRRYVDYYFECMENAASQADAAESLATSWHNAQGALRYAINDRVDLERAPTIVPKLCRFWSATGRANEGLAWLQRASVCRALSPAETLTLLDASARMASVANRIIELEPLAGRLVRERELTKDDNPKSYGDALFLLGNAKWRLGKGEEAETLYGQALQHYEKVGDRRATAMLLGTLGITIAHRADSVDRLARAKALCQQSLRMFREDELRLEEAQALENLGTVHTSLGELPQALSVTQKALAMYRELGNPTSASTAHESIADVYLAMHRPLQALSELLAGRRVMTEVPRGPFCAYYAEAAFKAAVDLGAYNAAPQFYAFAEEWRRLIGTPRSSSEQPAIDARYVRLTQVLAAPILDELLRDGVALGLPEIDALVEQTLATFTRAAGPDEQLGPESTNARSARNLSGLVRSRLALRLDQATLHPVVFITAGAAWGKSTAIEQYLSDKDDPVIRLALDADDLTLPDFISRFREAIEAAVAPAAWLPLSPTQPLAPQLSQWLANHTGCVVIDNLHRGENEPGIAQLLFDVMSRMKGHIRWFVLSHLSEQAPIGTCTAYGLTGQAIDERDLAFTFDEAMEYAETLNAEATPEDIQAIMTLTEGWPLAISVALEALAPVVDKPAPQRAEHVKQITMARVAPFIRENIYSTLNDQDRRLLLMAGAMPGDLRADVIRQVNRLAEDRVPALASALSLRRVSDTAYRLPPLLRGFLVAELAKSPERNDIGQTLAEAYQRVSDPASAVRVLIAIRAYERVLAILEEHMHVWSNGEWPELLEAVVPELPVHLLSGNATALLAQATVLARHNRVDHALQVAEQAQAIPNSVNSVRLTCAYAALRLDHGRSLSSAPIEAAIAAATDPAMELRAKALLCCAHLSDGHPELAQSLLPLVLESIEALVPLEFTVDIPYWAAVAAYGLRDYATAKMLALRIISGHPRERWLVVAQANDLLAQIAAQTAAGFDELVTYNSAALNAAQSLGDLRHYRSYLERRCVFLFYHGATDLIELAMNQPDTLSTPLWNTYSTIYRFLTGVENATEQEGVEDAGASYTTVLQVARQLPADEILADDQLIATTCLMMVGTLANDITIKDTIAQALDAAQVALHDARLPTAIRHASLARLIAITCNMLYGELSPIAHLAPILDGPQDDPIVQAVAAVVRPAIHAAYRGKKDVPLRRPQRDAAQDPAQALTELRTRGYGTIATLLSALVRKSAIVVASGVVLTPKETEVLLVMAQGLPPGEIAETLHISLNTVLTHQKRIFQKFGVSDKLAAVNQARALGLV